VKKATKCRLSFPSPDKEDLDDEDFETYPVCFRDHGGFWADGISAET
jgi:hypothetical protein